MKDVNVTSIVPLGEFKAKASALLRKLGADDEPIVITQNGRPAGVLVSPAAFDQLRERQRFLEAVAVGAVDLDAGHGVDHGKVKRWLDSWGTDDELPPPR